MTDEELKAFRAEIDTKQAVLNFEHSKRMKDFDVSIAELNAQIKKNDDKLTRMGLNLGSMANNHGESTEEYFYNSLYDDPRLGNIKFDEISKNLHGKLSRLEDEFDIAMFNGKNVALIECKYKANESDVMKLVEKKVENFKLLFPYYANHTFYLGIASFSFYPKLEKLAKENGVAILRQKGEVVVIEADNLKGY